MWAALQGRTEVAKTLVEGGANIEFKDSNGNTALMMAANRGRTETVKTLLALGANPYKVNTDGQTANEIAKMSGYPELEAMIKNEPYVKPAGRKRRK